MIDFLCSHCGAQLRVPRERAGKSGKCPRCKRVVEAPLGAVATESGDIPDEIGLASNDSGEPLFESRVPVTDLDLQFLAPKQQPDEIGRLGPYRVLSVLGTGGMGLVFLAEDLTLGRQVALKALKPGLASDEMARKRFLREARTAASLHHDHIVSIYQVGEDRGIPYLAMQVLQGESLEDLLNRRGGRLELAEVLRIGRETAEGLQAAHEQGLVHRDVKPDNLWLELPRGRVKILDFGLARSVNENARVTQAGMLLGTPAYMPPEQAERDSVDPRGDLFSLGCVLYRMSTGQLPFRGRTTMAVLLALAAKTPRAPHVLNPSLPRIFSDLVMQLLNKVPEDRPDNALEVAELLEEMEQALEEGTIHEMGEEEDVVDEIKPRSTDAPRARKEKKKPRPRPGRARPHRGKRPDREASWERRAIVLAILTFVTIVVLFLVLLGQHIWKHIVAGENKKSHVPESISREVVFVSLEGSHQRIRASRSALPGEDRGPLFSADHSAY